MMEPKGDYIKPALTDHGSVSSLTLSTPGSDINMMGMMGMMGMRRWWWWS